MLKSDVPQLDVPKLVASVVVAQLDLRLSHAQYRDALHLVSFVAADARRRQPHHAEAMRRNALSLARRRWLYAGSALTAAARERRESWRWCDRGERASLRTDAQTITKTPSAFSGRKFAPSARSDARMLRCAFAIFRCDGDGDGDARVKMTRGRRRTRKRAKR